MKGEKTMANRCLEEWVDRLGLQDWTIKFEDCVASEDMILENCSGCTDYVESTKCAKIQIVDPDSFGKRIAPFDFEETVVHELLHLKFSLLDESGNAIQDRLIHQFVDDMARALIDVKRP